MGPEGSGRRGWRPRVDPGWARLLGGAGAVAVFGSLIGEWQVTDLSELLPPGTGGEDDITELMAGVAEIGAWGAGWLVGVFALLAATAVALFAQPALRGPARAVGLAGAAALALVVTAAAAELSRESVAESAVFGFRGLQPDTSLEVTLGRGLFAGYGGLLLLAAALWLLRSPAPAPPAGTPEGSGGSVPVSHVQSAVPSPPPAPASGASRAAGTAVPYEDTSGLPDPGEADPSYRATEGPDDLTVAPTERFASPPSGHGGHEGR